MENDHPEVTWSALWQQVWYEGYPEPMYVWQSTSASNDFPEAKLSLVPLVFRYPQGLLLRHAVSRGALGVAGAIYTAYFMSAGAAQSTSNRRWRSWRRCRPSSSASWRVSGSRPSSRALPGDPAAAPAAHGHAADRLVWNCLPERGRTWLPEGWHAILLIPVLLFIGWGAFALSPIIENAFMHGDSRIWLTHDMGIKFDQRNSPGGRHRHGLRRHPHHLLHRRRRRLLGAQAPDPGVLALGATRGRP